MTINEAPVRELSVRVAHGARSISVVSVAGDLSLDSSGRLRDCLSASDRERGTIVLETSALTSIDAFGLGTIMEAHRAARSHGGDLVVVAPDPRIAHVFAVSGLQDRVEVYRDLGTALTR